MNRKWESLQSRFYTPARNSGRLEAMTKGFSVSREEEGGSSDLSVDSFAELDRLRRKIAIVRRVVLEKAIALARLRLWEELLLTRLRSPLAGPPSPPAHTLLLNQSFHLQGTARSPYVLIRVIGKGGFSIVWEVLDTLTCEHRAAKVTCYPDPNTAKKAIQWLKRCFTREVMVLHNELHPNILRLQAHFTWQIKDSPLHGTATIHELCRNDLASYFKTTPVDQRPRNVMFRWLGQLAAALHRLHCERRVVHMDLKPQNILIAYDDSVKICDFGLHLLLEEDENSFPPDTRYRAKLSMKDPANWTGTVIYQPPEHIEAVALHQDDYYVDASYDIWSLGCIAYEMFTGEVLMVFKPKNKAQIYREAYAHVEAVDLESKLNAITDENDRDLVRQLLIDRPVGNRLIRCLQRH